MFLYTNYEILGRESKKKNPIYLVLQMIPRNQLKEAKELYSENHKTLIKKIENYMQKWKDIPFPCIGKVNIIKVAIIPKEIYRFNAISIQ